MKEHPKYKGYYLTEYGEIYSSRKSKSGVPKLMKPLPNQKGYMRAKIRYNGRSYSRSLGRLVLETYSGFSDLEVDHINRDRSDNRLSNLRYVTRQENIDNSYKVTKDVICYDTVDMCWVVFDNVGSLIDTIGGSKQTAYKAISKHHLFKKRYAISYLYTT